ncbi:TonB-dependent receptor plug domain-containing protein [Lacinutrix salivirga]
MSKSVFTVLLFITFLVSTFNLIAQNETNKMSFAQLLTTLETQYNVTFSYADDSLKNATYQTPNTTFTLHETLVFLNNTSNLEFRLLDNNIIVIRKKNDSYQPNFETLENVLITSYLTKGIALNTLGSITIKPKTFEILPGLIEPDILHTVQALPGVTSVNETVSNLNIRGGTNDQNLLLWDGVKMYQSGHFFGLISAFNPYVINTVDVTKNGTSAKYGDGVSGTIHMQLDKDVNTQFSGGSGFNLIHADGFAKIPFSDKLELQISARRSLTDLVETPTYTSYFKRIFQDTDLTNNKTQTNNTVTTNEAFYFYDITGKLIYNPSEKDKISISAINIYNTLNYLEEATVNNTQQALQSGITQRNFAGTINYYRDWNPRFKTNVQAYFSHYQLSATNFDLISNQRLIQQNTVLDTGIFLDAEYKLNTNFKLKGGFQFFEVGVKDFEDVNNPIFRSSIKNVLKSQHTYTEAKYVSNNKITSAKIGVRSNYFSEFDLLLIEPRLSFSHKFLDHFRVEVLGEFKSQSTSQSIDLQNDFLGIEKRRWVLANDKDVPIIESKQASLGLHYNKNKLLISTEAYYKKVENITARSQGFQNQFQFINAFGNYTITGIDFLIHKQFKNLNSWLSYTYSNNNYTFKPFNEGKPFANNVDLNHIITLANTYKYNDFKFAIGVNWRTGKPTTLPQPENSTSGGLINYQLPNSSRLNNYIRVDFSTTYNFEFSEAVNAKVGVSIWNILNTKNRLNTYSSLDLNDNSVSRIDNNALGITPNINFRVHF